MRNNDSHNKNPYPCPTVRLVHFQFVVCDARTRLPHRRSLLFSDVTTSLSHMAIIHMHKCASAAVARREDAWTPRSHRDLTSLRSVISVVKCFYLSYFVNSVIKLLLSVFINKCIRRHGQWRCLAAWESSRIHRVGGKATENCYCGLEKKTEKQT